MDAERARAFLLTLPHVAETLQWGDNLLFWAGDKSIGGRMFAVIDLAANAHGVVSFAAGPEHFAELVEREAFRPAPYLARAHWVAASDWNALRPAEWQEEFRAAHAIVSAKLPARVRRQLELNSSKRAPKRAARTKPSASGSR